MPWEIPITVEDTTYPVRFNTEVEPTQADIDEAVAMIMQQRSTPSAPAADQPGRLGSFASNVGRGALSVIPGTIGGVGYALGSDTLTGAADTIEGGINRMLPVNPEYQDELLMKGGQAVGQAIGMLGTGGAVGAAGKSLALSRGLAQGAAAAKGANLAKNVMLGTGIAQGTRGGGQAAEQYGMQGGAAYARALLGGAIEGASERYLFGMGTELAPVKKFLGEAAEKGVGGIIKSTGTEAGEEAVSQIGGNVATSVLAPYGVQTPGVLEGVGESALLGGIAGGTIGGINALMQPSPTIEGDALVPTEQAPPPVEEPEDDYGVAAFQQQMTEIAAQPDPIAPIQQTVTAAAENSVRVNANVLPATAAVIEAGGLAPAPTVAPSDPAEILRKRNAEAKTFMAYDSEDLVDRKATREKREAAAKEAGMTLETWETEQAALNQKSKENFFAALNEGDTLEWTDLSGRKGTGIVEIGLDGKKVVRNTTEESPAEGYLYGPQAGIFAQFADSLKVTKYTPRRRAAPVVEQPAPIVEQPRTREEEIAQMRAMLRLNLSAEEREDMEQQLAQAQDEGVLADVFAEERRKAAQRDDFLRRQQDLENERQRLADEGILGDVFAEERQRATAREQQRQQPPVVEETVAPIQPAPVVEETGAPVETKGKKSKTKPKTVEQAQARIAEQQAASEFVSELRAEKAQEELRNKKGKFISDNAADNKESTFLSDLLKGGWDKSLDDVQAGRVTPQRAATLAQAAADAGLIDTFTAKRFTPEQVPNVENVIDEPGAAEVGSGMEVPPKVGNTGAIPTAEESARWDAVNAYTTPIVKSKTDEDLDALGFALGVKRQGLGDSAYQDKILANTHPDDLLDALNPPAVEAPAPAPIVQRDVTKPEIPAELKAKGIVNIVGGSKDAKTFDKWLADQGVSDSQINPENGDGGAGYLYLDRGTEKAGQFSWSSKSRTGVDSRLVFKLPDGRNVVWLIETQSIYEVDPTKIEPNPYFKEETAFEKPPEQMSPDEAWADEQAVMGKAASKEDTRMVHEMDVNTALGKNKSVSAAAVDAYKITLPEGYVRQGDLYVFQPSGTVEAVADEAETYTQFRNRIERENAEEFQGLTASEKSDILDDYADLGQWGEALVKRAETEQLSDEVLDDYVDRFGLDTYAIRFRGKAEQRQYVPKVERQKPGRESLDVRTRGQKAADTRKAREKAPAKPKNMAGEVRPERAKPTPAPEFTTLHPKTQEKFNTAFEAKDAGAMNSLLDPTNKGSRAEFERRTGVKLPTTQKGTRDSVETWAATTPVADLTDTELDRDLLRLGEYSKKTYASDALKARALELAKEFQKRQDVVATKPAETELAQVGDEVTWMAAGGEARGTVYAVRGDSADIDYFGPKTVPLSELSIVRKSGRRLAQEKRDAEAAASTAQKKPQEPEQPKPKSKFTKAEVASLEQGKTPEGWTLSVGEPVTVTDTKGKTWEVKMQFSPTRTMTLVSGDEAQTFDVQTAPQPKPAAEVETPVAEVLTRGKPRESIVFKKPVPTPLGDVIGYSWSSQLVEDVDKMGEPVLRRISNWEEAANNAETGRDIVHRFLIKKPDGTTSEVSLESTFGKMTDSDKKTVKAVVSAAKKLPFMRAELAELQDLQKQAEADYQRTQKLKPDPAKLELREPDVKWRAEKGDKVAYLEGVFLGYVESSELNAKGELANKAKFIFDNAWKWRDAKRTVRVTDTQKDRAKSLARSIKKAEALLSRENVEVAKVTTSEQPTSLAETGPPVREMKTPSVTTDQPAPISTRPSLGSTGKQIVSEWRSLQGTKVAPGETVVGWDVNGGGTYAFINDKLVKLKRDNKGFESTYTDATDADWQDVSDALDRGALQVEVRKITGLGNYLKVDAGKTVKVLHQATGKPLQEFLGTPEGAAYEARMQKAMAERGPDKFGSTNTVVTKEAKDQAAKSLRESLGQTNVGLNPATLKYAIIVGTYYIEGGARSFADFSAKMVEEFGEGVRKYLQPAYEALRKRTDIDTTGMDPVEGVETAPVVEAPTAPAPAPAVKVEAEAPRAAPTQATPRPVPAPSQEPDVVAIANDPVDIQREALGLPPIMRKTQEAYTFPQMWSDAEAAMQANPERGKALVKTLNDNPRNISALEDAILLRERVNRVNALDLAMVEFNKAPKGNNEDQRRAMDDAITSLTDLDNALAVAGTEQGRSLNARKMLARQDYTLAKMISTLRAANDGDLSEADLATVTRLQKQIDETQKKLAEVESGQADRIAEAEKIAFEAGRKEVLKDIEERAKNEAERVAEMQKRKAEYLAAKKEAAKTPNKWEEIRAAARARNAELRSNLYSDVVLVKAASMAVNDVIIGATYIAEGVTKFADWVSKMRSEDINLTDDEMQQLFKESKAFDAGEDLPASEAPLKVKKAKAPAIDKVKAIAADEEALDSRTVYNLVVEKMKKRAEESKAAKLPEMSADDLTSVISEVTADVKEFFPDITEREIRDLFSGYGKILMPSKEELAKQIRQLSALGKLQSAIEDAEAKRAPLKSGPQRDKATQAIRLQQKKLARELRMMGRDYEAGEEQLRSPLDAIKARLNNQIDDLAMEINTRKKAPRRPSVDYDKDTQELADLRDELKRISDFINAPAGPTFTELVNEEKDKLDKRIGVLEKALESKQFMPKEDRKLYTQELQVKRDKRDELNEQIRKLRKIEADKSRTQEDIDRAAIASVKESIAELDRKIKEKDFARPERRTPTETAEYLALVAKKEALQDTVKEERLKLFGRKSMTDEQRVKQAAAAIDKSIERMQKMLTSGNYDVPKRTSKTPETPELAQKRETRDKLRKQLLELRKLKRDALIDPIAKQLKTDKKRIQTRMDKLKKRMETGDFSKPEKRKKATDDELLALQVEEEDLKEAWAKMVFERQLASRGPGKRLLDAGQQTLNTARAVLTSFDVSAVLRQGGFIVLGNPLRGFRNLGPMFQAFGSDKFAKEEKFRLERRENFKNGAYQQSKLFLADVNKVDQMTQQEEAFMSRWIKKLPKGAKGLFIGSAIQGSQRAYTVFLNRLRMDTFDAMVANLKKGSEPTPQEMSAVANYINIATGRGDLGKFNQAGTMLNTVFFAPRLVASRFQILAGYPYFTASGRTKALVLREYGKFFAGATLVYVIGALAQGDDDEPIETDPRSSDFLKIRFGDTRVDPLSGLIQATVLVSRLVSGEKKQASGKIVPIRGEKVPYGADDSFDVMGNFVRTKFSPIVGSAVNVVTGKNVVGEPTDIGEETKRMLIPMSFTEMKETLEAQGVPEATALIMLQLFGMGVQTYTPGKK